MRVASRTPGIRKTIMARLAYDVHPESCVQSNLGTALRPRKNACRKPLQGWSNVHYWRLAG